MFCFSICIIWFFNMVFASPHLFSDCHIFLQPRSEIPRCPTAPGRRSRSWRKPKRRPKTISRLEDWRSVVWLVCLFGMLTRVSSYWQSVCQEFFHYCLFCLCVSDWYLEEMDRYLQRLIYLHCFYMGVSSSPCTSIAGLRRGKSNLEMDENGGTPRKALFSGLEIEESLRYSYIWIGKQKPLPDDISFDIYWSTVDHDPSSMDWILKDGIMGINVVYHHYHTGDRTVKSICSNHLLNGGIMGI